MDFRTFLAEAERMDGEVRATLRKLPAAHRKLVQGWKYGFEKGHTLAGDRRHVGCLDYDRKKITVAAPWNFGREYTLLHEIGHRVWDDLVPDADKEKWKGIVRKTKPKPKDTAEELFCMVYAQHYSNTKVVAYDHPAWLNFIRKGKWA